MKKDNNHKVYLFFFELNVDVIVHYHGSNIIVHLFFAIT